MVRDTLQKIFGNKHALVEAYWSTFETPQGEVVLAHLAKNCHVFEPVVAPGDPQLTAMRDGERRVVLSILKMLNYDLGKLQQLMEQTTNE